MIKKLLLKSQNKFQLIFSFVGTFVGFSFIFIAIHYFIEINNITRGEELLVSNTVLVQKKVSSFSALNLSNNTFSKEEIDELLKYDFISKIDPIVNNSFDASIKLDEKGMPYFRTKIFVQSVSDSFLDVKTSNWKWKKGDKIVPLVMPKEFHIMLNQFLSSQGIPQISEDLAKQLKFTFKISGKGEAEELTCKIVGFTQKLSAIMIPQTFMNYANRKFGMIDNNPKYSMIMLELTNNNYGDFEKLAKKKKLELKENDSILNKTKSFLKMIVMIGLISGILTIVMSIFVFVLYSELIISKSSYQIKTLIRIGYKPVYLIKKYTTYFALIVFVLLVLALIFDAIVIWFVAPVLNDFGFQFSQLLYFSVFIIALIIGILFVILNYVNIRLSVLKLAKKS